MIRGIQSAAAAMEAQMAAQDITANNLANVNTAGYKRDVPSFHSVLAGLAGAAPTTSVDVEPGSDMSTGPLIQTDDPSNLALEGRGFFSIQTPGGAAYTRDGSFSVRADGVLATQAGDPVMGEGGAIHVSSHGWSVDGQGIVSENGTRVDRLQLVQIAPTAPLAKLGGNLLTADPTAVSPLPIASVRQGYLEGSNVNTVREMAVMISGFRGYEASQKAIQAQDETLDKLVNEVGRVG